MVLKSNYNYDYDDIKELLWLEFTAITKKMSYNNEYDYLKKITTII